MRVESRSATELHPISAELKPLIVGMCRYPLDLRYVEELEGNNLDICILPNQADFRVLLGRQASRLNSIKLVARTIAGRLGLSCSIELKESGRGEPEGDQPFEQNPEFDVARTIEAVRRLCRMGLDREAEITHRRDNDKLRVMVVCRSPEEEAFVWALNDVFYSWGFRNGMIVKIKAQ